MKKVGIVILIICIAFLLILTGNLYYKLGKTNCDFVTEEKFKEMENRIADLEDKLETKESTETVSNQNDTENVVVELKEGTYVNSDDPEIHCLTLSNGKATYETLESYVGTYTIEGNKINIIYTEAYDPEGNEMELPDTEKEGTFIIDGDTLIKDDEYRCVYKLQ